MKAALLFYHSVYDNKVHEMLDALGCVRFIEVPTAWAKDESDRRFGSHIYPGTDSVLVAFVDEPCAEKLADAVQRFQKERAREHTHLALLQIDQFV